MTIASTSSARARRLPAAVALLISFALVGCAGDPGEAPASPESQASPAATEAATEKTNEEQTTPATSGETATLSLPDASFTFELEMCLINETDILVGGPGKSDDTGEVGYLSVDFVRGDDSLTGDARVDIGATTQFQSMDEIYVFSTEYRAGDYSLMVVNESLTLEAEFHSGDGSAVGPGVLKVDCE